MIKRMFFTDGLATASRSAAARHQGSPSAAQETKHISFIRFVLMSFYCFFQFISE